MVRRLAGTMYIKDLAEAVGSSDSSLDRWAKRNGVNINALRYRPETIRAVSSYYEKNGLPATKEAFPDISVRSIIEKYKQFAPRQMRWTEEQIAEAAKMAGLISHPAQAKFFNRPGAGAGSIHSLWQKRFGYGECSLNGMVHNFAKHLVTSSAKYLRPLGTSRAGERIPFRRLILWVDMENYLKPETPDFIRDAIETMARFQKWLWRSENPKPLILKMIKEREFDYAVTRKE